MPFRNILGPCDYWFDRLGQIAWDHCCVEHDLAYTAGGSEAARNAADAALQACVAGAGAAASNPLLSVGLGIVAAFMGLVTWSVGRFFWPKAPVDNVVRSVYFHGGQNTQDRTMGAQDTFRAKAPGIMSKLIADFAVSPEDAAAIVGNLGHECLGFTKLQEMNPTVRGSRGGFGWAQWTGPRRRAYEAYCSRNGKNPASDEANYAYLYVELKGIEGSERRAIPAVKAAIGLDAKVEAFERAFLRAGVKHYDSRKQWARIALDEWEKPGARIEPVVEPAVSRTTVVPPPAPARGPNGMTAIIVIVVVGLLLAAIGLAPAEWFLGAPE